MLLPQQKTTTLVKILFRAAHTYSKDSKKVSGKLVKKSGRPSTYFDEVMNRKKDLPDASASLTSLTTLLMLCPKRRKPLVAPAAES